MGVDARRDHSFRVPDPAASVQSGVANACTQCHRDRDDRWAADFLARRSGRVEPWYTHTALIAAARRHDAAAIPGLLAYANAPANPPMLRAMALQESARFPSQQQLQAVSRELASADPLLRAGAAQAVGYLDPSQRLQLLRPLLEDPVRSVRMAVARQLADQRLADAPAEARAPLGRLFDEYRQALLHNADMPESMSDLGVFLLAQGDAQGAEQALLHARALARRFLPATLNLSDIYRARDRDDLGEPLLREAMQQYPQSGDARHMLGLLYVRTGRTPASVELFRQASQLSPDNPQYALVYAVSLAETGNMPAAIRVLETATTRFPGHGPLRQALEGYRSRQP
jgi:tetratricopeptide (TPR) repeat protein